MELRPFSHVVDLFDGRHLDGWAMAGPGGFDLVDGVLVSRGGMGLLWYQRRELDDFVLEVEWRVSRPTDNSGVFLRFADPAGDPWAAVRSGYEVQILDTAGEPVRRTGAVYTLAPPVAVPTRPVGEWNRFAITTVGQRYRVVLNGREVTRFVGDRRLSGFVGLQNHDEASVVGFRRVRARTRPADPRPSQLV